MPGASPDWLGWLAQELGPAGVVLAGFFGGAKYLGRVDTRKMEVCQTTLIKLHGWPWEKLGGAHRDKERGFEWVSLDEAKAKPAKPAKPAKAPAKRKKKG